MIEFKFENKIYVLPENAYDENKIQLPDGRIFQVSWLESYPPQPSLNIEEQPIKALLKELSGFDMLIEAISIFTKYSEEDFPTSCEHDIMYIHVDPEIVSEKDKKRLEELHFNVSEDLNCFTSTRFGSA